MPGMDGIAATEAIYATHPGCEVIMMSVQGEPDYLRRAMLAGAREYLVKPFTGDELAGSIRQVYEAGADKRARMAAMQLPVPAQVAPVVPEASGRMIAVFSPKGGVGRTTLATNVAIGIRTMTGKRVALVDGSLLFGDVAIMLNLQANKSISDLVAGIQTLDQDLIESVMLDHPSGVRVLLVPSRPELAELVHAEHLRKVLALLKSCYDYVILDTHPALDDSMLAALDLSDRIILLTTLEMPAIKNVKLFLEVAAALHYPQDKLMLVLSRPENAAGIDAADIEESIRFKVTATIANAGQAMAAAVNQGVPIVMSNRGSAVAEDFLSLATKLLTESDALEAREKSVGVVVGERKNGSGTHLRGLRLLPFGGRRGGN